MAVKEGLGVDIGGVIIARAGVEADTSFSGENYLNTAEVPGAFEAIRRLVEGRFGRRVFLVSKAGPRTQTKTLRWLKHHRFFETTGVKPKQVHFCLERNEKESICRKLGITHFVDDRLDVLRSLSSVPDRFLLLEPSASKPSPASSRSIQIVRSWDAIAKALLP